MLGFSQVKERGDLSIRQIWDILHKSDRVWIRSFLVMISNEQKSHKHNFHFLLEYVYDI